MPADRFCYVAADHVENQIDFTEVFQQVVLKVDEFICAEFQRFLTVGRTSRTDYVRSGLTR